MLATFGFTITGICFAIFAYTFHRAVVQKTNLKLESFSNAYYLLACAMLVWGIASGIGGDTLLQRSVLIGNAFLLMGSLFMLSILLGKKKQHLLIATSVVLIGLLAIRSVFFAPEPYIQDGVLIFNTPPVIAAILVGLFAGIWLPANLRVAKVVTTAIGQETVRQIYSAIYIAATLSAIIFLSAHRTVTVVASFAAIGICFALLVSSNVMIAKMTELPHGKR